MFHFGGGGSTPPIFSLLNNFGEGFYLMNGNSNTRNARQLRSVLCMARDSVKCFETNVSIPTLKMTTDICAEGIKQVGNVLVAQNINAHSAGLLNIIAEIIHRVLNIIKLQENVTKLGQNVVVESLDKFIELIEEIIHKVGSYNVVQQWTKCYNLENLSSVFPVQACIVPKNLTQAVIQAHSKLFLFKGDLLRYRCNIMNLVYEGSTKAYWMAFSLLPSQGIVFNLLGVIAFARDNLDRLSSFFFFFRALYAEIPFENATEFLMTKLGDVSDRMIQFNFSQHTEIFERPLTADLNEYYYPWFKNSQSEPNWKSRLSKLAPSNLLNIQNDNFFHLINLLCTKQSHPTLFPSCERFLILTQYLLDVEIIPAKQILQITTIFLLALKSRSDEKKLDENCGVVSRTFLYFIGLLFSKLYDSMNIPENDETKFEEVVVAKANTVLPSLVVIECFWESIHKLFSSSVYRSPTSPLDFAVIRTKICKLGTVFKNNLDNVSIKRTKFNDSSDLTFMLPEMIFCCLGSRFPADINPIQISSSKKNSNIFQAFLIRLSLAQILLSKMIKNELFGLNTSFDCSSENDDLSNFELFSPSSSDVERQIRIYENQIRRQICSLVDEGDKHKRYPIRAKQNLSAYNNNNNYGIKVYPVGVIPPHYISPRHGVWTMPGNDSNAMYSSTDDQLLNSSSSDDDDE